MPQESVCAYELVLCAQAPMMKADSLKKNGEDRGLQRAQSLRWEMAYMMYAWPIDDWEGVLEDDPAAHCGFANIPAQVEAKHCPQSQLV